MFTGGSFLRSSVTDLPHETNVLDGTRRPTPRELEVLRLVAEGASNNDIATQLSMSQRTVQFHLSRLFAKLDARSRTHMVHLARQRGWTA